MRVALIGGTGLVGGLLATKLVAAGHELHRLQRRPGGAAGEEHVLESGQWGAAAARLRPDVAISALGTTMRKAGGEAAFRAVDYAMVVEFARGAKMARTPRMIAISSVGADPDSRSFYLRTKGELERYLGASRFDRLDIFRPGLLRGARGGDRRLGERIGIALSPLVNPLLQGPLGRFAAIDAEIVADAVVASLELPAPGTHIHHNREIRRLARR